MQCARALRDEALVPHIERAWRANLRVCCADKVWHQMNREGIYVGHWTIERLMRSFGLRGAMRGKVVRTAVSDGKPPCLPDRVNRQFKVDRLNQLWVPDLTYVSTWQGFVYVAFVVDVFACCIVCRRVSSSTQTDFVLDALIHHSDRGSQGASIGYSERMAEAGIEPSVGSRGELL